MSNRVVPRGPIRVGVIATAVLGAGVFFFFFWTDPAVLLLILSSLLLTVFVPRTQQLIFGGLAIAKIFLAVVVSLLASYLFSEGVLPGQPDQDWYISTAQAIAAAVGRNGFFGSDYFAIVGLHNRLYNVVLGWITYLNGTSDIFVFRLLNTFLSLALVVYGVRVARLIYEGDERYQRWALLGVGLLPSMNIYAMTVLRDVMISLFLMMFVYYMVRGAVLRQLLVVGLTYFLRLQLTYLMIVVGIGWFLMRHRRVVERRVWSVRRWIAPSAGVLAIGLAAYLATRMIPILGYLTSFVTLDFLGRFAVAFPVSFLGLDFLFADSAVMKLGRMQLLLIHLITPETVILPISFVAVMFQRVPRKLSPVYVNLRLVVWIFALIYAFGYYVQYREIFVRLLLPIYPLMYLLMIPYLVTAADWITSYGSRNAKRPVLAP